MMFRFRKPLKLAYLVLAVTLLAGCAGLPAGLGRAAAADSRLTAEIQRLPVPAGALLVEQLITSTGGQIPECEGRWLQVLYGTNEMSLEEVLEFYESSLHGTKWEITLVDARARSFRAGDDFTLGVSDFLLLGQFRPEHLQDAEASYKTVYLLNLVTYLQQPVPSRCRGG